MKLPDQTILLVYLMIGGATFAIVYYAYTIILGAYTDYRRTYVAEAAVSLGDVFSTFSAEVVMLMQSGRSIFALGAVGAHLMGSLLMTFAGIATIAWLKG